MFHLNSNNAFNVFKYNNYFRKIINIKYIHNQSYIILQQELQQKNVKINKLNDKINLLDFENNKLNDKIKKLDFENNNLKESIKRINHQSIIYSMYGNNFLPR